MNCIFSKKFQGRKEISPETKRLAVLLAAAVFGFSGCGRRSPDGRARRLAERGRWTAAEAAAEAAAAGEPEAAEPLLLLGRIRKARGLYPEAIEAFESARELDPSSPPALFNLGAVYEAIGDLEEAEKFYRQAIRLSPRFSPAFFRLGGVLAARGKDSEAAGIWRDFLSLEPEDTTGRNNLAVVLFRLGEIELAREELERVLEIDDTDEQALFNLGVLHLAGGEEALFVDYFNRLQRLRPVSAAALEAERLLKQMLPDRQSEGERSDPPDHLLRGEGLEAENRLEEAVKAYRSALAADPADGRAHYRLGKLYERIGEELRAVEHYEEFLSLDRNFSSSLTPEILGRLSELRSRLGLPLLARGELPPTPPPSPPPTPGSGDWWRAGRRAEERRDWRAAVEEYRRALAMDSDHAPSWLGKGRALRNSGDYSGARAALEKARELDPRGPAERELAELFIETALSLAGEGKEREAIEYFRLARTAGLAERAEEGIRGTLREAARGRAAAGDFSAAAARLEESLEMKSDDASTRLELGDLYARSLDRPEDARRHYREYLRLAPRGAESGRVRAYLSPPATPPPPPPPPTPAVGAEVYYNRAVAAQRRGDSAEAEGDYLRAIEAREGFYRAHFNLGTVYRDTGRYEQSRRAFQRALEIEPDFSPAHLALFNLHRDRLPDPGKARHHARRFVELEPGSEPARILREWLGE